MSLEIEIIIDSDTKCFNAVSEVGSGAGAEPRLTC